MLIGMTLTTIKVPVELRDRLRDAANEHEVTQAALLEQALDALRRRDLFASMREFEPDEQYLTEMREWDRANFGTVLG